jgi:hypothetical protein
VPTPTRPCQPDPETLENQLKAYLAAGETEEAFDLVSPGALRPHHTLLAGGLRPWRRAPRMRQPAGRPAGRLAAPREQALTAPLPRPT